MEPGIFNAQSAGFTPFEVLEDCFQDLSNFAEIGPNNWIRLSNNSGHFIRTGGAWAALPGIQTMANSYRGDADVDQLMIQNFQHFTQKINSAVEAVFTIGCSTFDGNEKKKCFLKLVETQQHFMYALKGRAKIPGGGLNGILTTYAAQQETCEMLAENIDAIKITVATAFNACRDWYNVNGKMNLDWSQEWDSDANVNLETPENPGLWKYYSKYTVPLAYNQANYYFPKSDWRPWNVIYTDDKGAKLILGGLPCVIYPLQGGEAIRNDLKDFQDAEVGAILSVVEHFEMCSSGWVIDPIPPNVWVENGIHQLELPVQDFGSTDLVSIEKGVEFIHSEMAQGRSVYVHCKAGRGRSYLLTACYLIKHGNLSLREAMALIKKKRPQVNLDSSDEKTHSLHQYALIYDSSFEYDPTFKPGTTSTISLQISQEGTEEGNMAPVNSSENCVIS